MQPPNRSSTTTTTLGRDPDNTLELHALGVSKKLLRHDVSTTTATDLALRSRSTH